MIARCVHNTGVALGEPSRGDFYTTETVFNLEVGKDYILLGLGIFETILLALVRDETGKPNWLPVGLFELEDTRIPTGWEFGILDSAAASGGDPANRWVARWGYPELVRNEAHCDALLDRDPRALAVFDREWQARSSGAGR